ncbi:MAG: hypothetical protein WCK74_07520 [Gemmatimonadaceae bacterium]
MPDSAPRSAPHTGLMARVASTVLLTLPLALSALTGCASGGGSTLAAGAARPAQQTTGIMGAGLLAVANSAAPDVATLPYAADAVWKVLPAVFDSLGIPLTTLDQSKKSIGNEGMKIRQRLGKTALSRYIDCGNTQIGPNADSYDVFLSVLTTVTATSPSSATVTTVVEAKARPATYNQAYSDCATRGGIELRISELVKARLAK